MNSKRKSAIDQAISNHRNLYIGTNDLSDLYLLILQYWRTYWQTDETYGKRLLELAEDVKYVYEKLYPNEISITDCKNARGAGRHKKYNEEYNKKIMSLADEGYGPTYIAQKLHCSKSYVSKLIRKQFKM